MHYELVSRTVAYVACFSTLSLLMTSMAIAAVNVGRPTWSTCPLNACVAGIVVGSKGPFEALTSQTRLDALAAKLWPDKA
jgi:hypothetical protein